MDDQVGETPGKPGLLLVNLGTPDAPRPQQVRRYLREFLSDPHVIDLNPVGRWLLLNLIILPFRPKRSAEAYAKIWTSDGSPLLVHGRALAAAVSERAPDFEVELGMRYGSPSIPDAMRALRERGCDELVVFPLYPQYAMSSTASTIDWVQRQAERHWGGGPISFVPPFYDHPAFLDAFAAIGQPILQQHEPDHVLFSFHGLPERHIRLEDTSGSHCLASADCCNQITDVNRNCYRAQSLATARGLAERLGLGRDDWTMGFQSRLTKNWIAPFTDELLKKLPHTGARRLVVFCPAFVADCLETLEEIAIRAREDFIAAGGESLHLVPSLNSSTAWVDAVLELARSPARA
jgi:ferrochelatase